MRALAGLVTAGCVLLATGVASEETAHGCALPPRISKAQFDAGGARYEWMTTCDGALVVIRGSYNDRTHRATQVVTFPDLDGATNSFDVRCSRNPWAPGDRLPCTSLRGVVNRRAAFAEPWLGYGVLRATGPARAERPNRAQPGAPTPLLPPSGVVLRSRDGRDEAPVELRWTSSAGPAVRYRVELQRSISARGPFSHVHDVDLPGTQGLSTGYTIPSGLLTAGAHHYWRWRVGQTTDGRVMSYSAWQAFSLR